MIGFNPLPDISLGDMEAVMDLGNELNLFKTNSDVSREKEKVSHIDTDRIMQTFSIQPIVKETKQAEQAERQSETRVSFEEISQGLEDGSDLEDVSGLEDGSDLEDISGLEGIFGEQDGEQDDLGDIDIDGLDGLGLDDLEGFGDEEEETAEVREEAKPQAPPIQQIQQARQVDISEEDEDDEFGDLASLAGFGEEDETDGPAVQSNTKQVKSNEDEQDEFDISFDDGLEGFVDEEPKQEKIQPAKPLNRQAAQVKPIPEETTSIEEELSQEEIELQERIARANKIKQQEEAKAERLRLLRQQAQEAEQQAQEAKNKRLAEQERLSSKQLQQVSSKKETSKPAQKDEAREAMLKKQRLQDNLAKLALLNSAKKNVDTTKRQADSKETKVSEDDARYKYYAGLDIDALYDEVKLFLKKHNIEKKLIDKKILEAEFGTANIHKLMLKSYLISMKKGVTIGK